MATNRRNGPLALRLVLACGVLVPAWATAQEQSRVRENVVVELRSDEEYAELLERLELGMSALEELGREDALNQLRRIADEVREERAVARGGDEGPRKENEEIRTVRRRLEVMRYAVDAFLEARNEHLAHRVEQAMHARELAIEGRRDAEAAAIRESAPDRGELAELLAGASRLYQEWERPERAQALADLSDVYGQQWRRRQQAAREGIEREPVAGLDSLERRMRILRLARAAHAETGRLEAVRALEHAVHYGELMLEGAGDEALSEAREGVPDMGGLIELVRSAAGIYHERGNAEGARLCGSLARYYAERLGEDEGEDEQEHEGEGEGEGEGEHEGDIEQLERRIEIVRYARKAYAEAGRREGERILERFLHVAELQQSGADMQAIGPAFEGLSMGMIIEHLQVASALWAEWGHETKAAACNELAEFYARRQRGSAPGPAERERQPDWNLEDRGRRLDVLRQARGAHAEAGHLDATDLLERFIRVGELQQAGASDGAIAEAAQGLSMGTTIELLQRASVLYREWGNADRAQVCGALAEFYAKREAARAEGGSERADRPREPSDEEVRVLLERLRALQKELKEVQAKMDRLGREER